MSEISYYSFDDCSERLFHHRQLIATIHTSAKNVIWLGILYAGLLFIVTAIRGFVCTHWLYQCDLVGMHMRSLITTTIYRKVKCRSVSYHLTIILDNVLKLSLV